MSIIRRVYYYAISLITLGIFATGVGQLLNLVFDLLFRGTSLGGGGFTAQQFSFGLAMLIIGGPLWFFFWRTVQRNVGTNEAEIGSAIRKFYLNLVLVVSAFLSLYSASAFLMWLLAALPRNRFPSAQLAMLLIGFAIWLYHWRLAEAEGTPSPVSRTLRRWYVYIFSAWSLVQLSVAVVGLVTTAILFLPIWGKATVYGTFLNAGVTNSIAWIVLAGLSWFFHWFRMAAGDFDSTLRQVYLYLLAILGGSIAFLVAFTSSLYKVIIWLLGGVTQTAGTHFQMLSWAIPTMLVAAALWSYHRRVTQEEAGEVHERQLSAQRVQSYLMTGLGLGTLIAGLIVLIGVIIESIIVAIRPPIALAPGWWRQQLALSLALLIVATPIWLYYWRSAIRRVAEGGVIESRARSRRILLYIVIGAAIVALTADLVNIVFRLLNAILQGGFGGFLSQTKWSWQTLVVAVPVLIYHWQVLREDQRRGAEAAVVAEAAVRKDVMLLIDERALDVVPRLEERLGFRVHVLRAMGGAGEGLALPDEEITRLVQEVQSASSNRVFVVISGDRRLVIPYQ